MITIARCLSEDYIHSSKLKNFCSSHGMTVSENKPELLRQIIEFAGEDESSEKYVETYDWLLEAIKEGSKEFCLKRVYVPEESIENLIAHDNFLLHKNTNCPKFLLSFSENDLEKVIDKRQNLLQYMNYKMNVLTMNAKNPTYDMLEQENK